MWSGLKICFAVALVVATVSATPTTPFVSHAYLLPETYLVRRPDGNLKVVANISAEDTLLSAARYNASNNDIGWDYLHVRAPKDILRSYDPSEGYFYAGYLEAYLTAQRIIQTNNTINLSPKASAWIDEHIKYMLDKSSRNRKDDAFWGQVYKILRQIEGLAHGFTAATGTKVSFRDLFFFSFQSEIGDVDLATSLSGAKKHKRSLSSWMSHCSALIKVTHDDLFVAHDTWNVFMGMAVRVYKVYEFESTITMSSYPAAVVSIDDWYTTSHELAVQETTNDVFNVSLYTAVVPHTVSEFIRVMVANYLATGGEEWTRLFARENSGTYNNQWMVVDFKVFVPGSSVQPNTLWIAEQVPGYVERGDMSQALWMNSYWASYNIPYFQYIYDISGYLQEERAQGTFWSYTKYARPEIFRRNQTEIKHIEHMQRMMRYNDYRHDPFSIIPNCTGTLGGRCSPQHSSMLTVASRGDLMPVYNSTTEMVQHYGPLWQLVAQGCFGAADSKIASWKERRSLSGLVINGPTNDQQPTFTWGSGACQGIPLPPGSPTVFDFPWVRFYPKPPE